MQTALIVLGIVIGVFSISLLIAYFFVLPALYVYFAPKVGSNAHLKAHLLNGGTIESYTNEFSA